MVLIRHLIANSRTSSENSHEIVIAAISATGTQNTPLPYPHTARTGPLTLFRNAPDEWITRVGPAPELMAGARVGFSGTAFARAVQPVARTACPGSGIPATLPQAAVGA